MLNLNNLEQELFDSISEMPVIDAHEHLPKEKERTAIKIDAATLFNHYCTSDLHAAGLKRGEMQNEFYNTEIPIKKRWKKYSKYVDAIKHGSYAYPAYTYAKEILKIDDINLDTVEEISKRLQKDNKKGLYKKLLQEICGIETCIQCKDDVYTDDQSFFVYLIRARHFNSFKQNCIENIEVETDMDIYSLNDYTEVIHKYVSQGKKKGAVGLKVGDAYNRKIEYDNVTSADAEKVLIKCRAKPNNSSQVSDEEGRILENYLIRRQVEACIEADLPVVIHTGFQAHNRNDIRNTRATHLWSLIKSYPKAKFDLFHGSFPYTSDMIAMGKYFANVSLNMCWMHIMGADLSCRALSEWLDAVPVTKIFAFGGDYSVVEKVYGHLQLARINVAKVLADKINQGRMNKKDALDVARLLFYDNAKAFYQIGKK